MPVVTVSGGLASGAREVARLAARRLNYDYVDQEILVQAARALGVSYERVESRDERTVSLGERLATMLRTFLERSAAAGVSDPMMGGPGLETLLARTYGEAAGLTEAEEPGFDERRYIETLTFVIQEIAEQRGRRDPRTRQPAHPARMAACVARARACAHGRTGALVARA